MNKRRQTICIPVKTLTEWNDLLRVDRVDFETHGFSDGEAIAKWATTFTDGKRMEISVHTTCRESGERYGFLNAEAMLFDKDGHPLVFTEPRRALDGYWELCTLDGDQYIVLAFHAECCRFARKQQRRNLRFKSKVLDHFHAYDLV